MESFSIQCESCQAKLKVLNPDLIGKRMACPGCKAPVLVRHPDESDGSPGTDHTSALDASFDDIDQLLSSPEKQKLANNPARPKLPAKAVEKEIPVLQNVAAAESLDPVAQQVWANPATQRKRRAITIIVALVGGLILLVAATAAWLSRPATVTDTQSQAPPATEVEPEAQVEKTATVQPSEPEAAVVSKPIDETPPDFPEAESGVALEPDSMPLIADTPPPVIRSDSPSTAIVTSPPVSVTPKSNKSSPSDLGNISKTNDAAEPSMIQQLRPVDALNSSLGELSSLLEQSGSSITEIADATAALQQDETIGLPRYYFQRPSESDVPNQQDIAKQLSLPCDGVLYKDAPLLEVFRDITLITGVPISFDMVTIAAGHSGPLLPEVSINISQTTFLDAIRQTVGPLGYQANVMSQGVVISLAGHDTVGEEAFDLSALSMLGEAGLNGFGQSIKSLFDRRSWAGQPDHASLALAETRLTVKHTKHVRNLIGQYIDKTVAAFAVSSQFTGQDNLDSENATIIKTRLESAAKSLSAPCDLPASVPGTVPDLLQRVYEKTGVKFLVNWETLGPAGWTPESEVPGNVSESTVAEMARQIAISMEAAFIVIDHETIEITSREDAGRRGYVEYYFVGSLHQKNFTADRIMQLIQEAAPDSLRRRNNLVIYEPGCQSVVVFGDQATQRVVAGVLDRLAGL